MEKSHYSLAWNKYHVDMCTGFSLLQQTGEMVDLTLAAEGQLIKVHQLVLRIASPFIRELIQSADCKHPVIFMNNMSHKTLCRVLQYVYTGEVSIEEEHLGDFMEAARTLHIRGLEGMVQPSKAEESTVDKHATELPIKKFQIEILGNKSTKLTEELQSQDATRNVKMKRKLPSQPFQGSQDKTIEKSRKTTSTPEKRLTPEDATDDANDSDHDYELLLPDNADDSEKEEEGKETKDPSELIGPKLCLQYTVSNKGSLQLILNRYMYNSRNYKVGPVRHWRCVDACNGGLRCPATAVTDNDTVIRRVHMHHHPYHDKRILAKFQKKAVFSAIRSAESELEIKPSDKTSGAKKL